MAYDDTSEYPRGINNTQTFTSNPITFTTDHQHIVSVFLGAIDLSLPATFTLETADGSRTYCVARLEDPQYHVEIPSFEATDGLRITVASGVEVGCFAGATFLKP
jgi:hypothetical protein